MATSTAALMAQRCDRTASGHKAGSRTDPDVWAEVNKHSLRRTLGCSGFSFRAFWILLKPEWQCPSRSSYIVPDYKLPWPFYLFAQIAKILRKVSKDTLFHIVLPFSWNNFAGFKSARSLQHYSQMHRCTGTGQSKLMLTDAVQMLCFYLETVPLDY